MSKLKNLIGEILPEVIEFRHNIHRHPELAGVEFVTSKYIREKIAPLNFEVHKPFLETDVVADLITGKPGKNILLRADIDALPIQETSGVPYASQIDGIMHGCGHDGHTAMLYGAALVLNRLRDKLSGNIRFCWQPGEEMKALGKQLVAAGVLENPAQDMVTALHGWIHQPMRSISFLPGPMMAGSGKFEVTIIGKGAHGTMPELSVDPIRLGSKLVPMIDDLVKNEFNSSDRMLIHTCMFHAGSASNIIPETAKITGSARFLEKSNGMRIKEKLISYLEQVLTPAGARYELYWNEVFIPAVNDSKVTEEVENLIAKEMNFIPKDKPVMGSEDFAFYLEKTPGVIGFLGLGYEQPPLHAPNFDFPDEALEAGIEYFVLVALQGATV